MTRRLFISLIALVSFFLTTGGATTAQAPELPFSDELQAALERGVDDYGAKGISIAILVPGYQLWTSVAGESHDLTPVTPDMVFSAGSIAKNFLAVLTLQLADEGILSLDDPISLWLPDYPHIDNTITIRQLLAHTSGVYNFTENDAYWAAIEADFDRVWTCDEVLTDYVQEAYFPPGEGWHYSSTGYSLLRLVLQHAVDADLATVLHQHVLEPLALAHTIYVRGESLPENTAHAWVDTNGDGKYDDLGGPAVAFDSSICGEVYASASDLAVWVNSLYHEQTVLRPQLLAQMLDFVPVSDPNEPLVAGYGLGVVRFSPEVFNGLEIWGHSGNALGYAAGALYLPNYGVSIGILTNTERGEGMFALNDILAVITANVEPVPSQK